MSTEDSATHPRTPADLHRLVPFLLARLDEDEAAARTQMHREAFLPYESIVQTADHRARHGPLRVLREVAGKRAVVQMWLDVAREQRERPEAGRPELVEAMMVAIAAVFADHPDFDPEWLAPQQETGEEHDNVVPFPGV